MAERLRLRAKARHMDVVCVSLPADGRKAQDEDCVAS